MKASRPYTCSVSDIAEDNMTGEPDRTVERYRFVRKQEQTDGFGLGVLLSSPLNTHESILIETWRYFGS